MRRKVMTAAFALMLAVAMTGCGGRSSVSTVEEITQAQESETQATQPEEITTQMAQEVTGEVQTKTEKKKAIELFPGEKKLVDIKMGDCVEKEQKVLCSVKMPSSYMISAMYNDAEGNQTAISGVSASDNLSDVIERGSMDSSEEVLNHVVLMAHEGYNNYTYTIKKTDKERSLEEGLTDCLNIKRKDDHKAYVGNANGQDGMTYAFVCQIDDAHSLIIGYSGDLAEEVSLENYGTLCSKLVTFEK